MLFTKTGKVLAVLGFILAVLRLGICIYIIGGADTQQALDQMVRRYLGSGSIGDNINEAIYVMIGCVVLGILCEISRNIQLIWLDQEEMLENRFEGADET